MRDASVSPKRAKRSLFRVTRERLECDDPALDPDHGGVGAIVSAQLGEDVLDAPFDGFFADGELRCDLFVRIPIGNQTQDGDLARSQGVVGGMLCEFIGDLRRQRLFSGMDGTDSFQQLLMQHIFRR